MSGEATLRLMRSYLDALVARNDFADYSTDQVPGPRSTVPPASSQFAQRSARQVRGGLGPSALPPESRICDITMTMKRWA